MTKPPNPLHSSRSAQRWVATLVLGLAACGDDFEARYEWQGENIDFRSERAEPPCAGTMAYLDSYTGLLGRVLSRDETVLFHWVAGAESLRARCPGARSGCTIADRVYSLSPIHLHEIVHALESPHPAGNEFFTEGLATLLGDTYYAPPVARLRDLSEIERWGGADGDYGVAAHFTSFLIETYGLQEVRDLAANAAIGRSGAESALTARFGVTPDELMALYEEYPDCTLQELHIPIYECLVESAPSIGDGVWSLEGDLVCASEGVLGPHAGRVFAIDAIEFSADNLFHIELHESDPRSQTRATLARCAPCSSGDGVSLGTGERYSVLQRGKYYVVVSQTLEHPSPYQLTVRGLFSSALPTQELHIFGWGTIDDHGCEYRDIPCLARVACERVSGIDCIESLCTCDGMTEPCFYPETMSAPPAVSFLARGDVVNSSGNICACDPAELVALGLTGYFDSDRCGRGLWWATPS